MTNHDIYTISIALNYTEGHLCKRVQSLELLRQNIESHSKTPTLKKCENPHGIVFVCLVYLVVDNSHIPLLSPSPSSISTCALNLLIWLLSFCPNSSSPKTIPQFLPPPLLHISLRLALSYSALLSLPFWS